MSCPSAYPHWLVRINDVSLTMINYYEWFSGGYCWRKMVKLMAGAGSWLPSGKATWQVRKNPAFLLWFNESLEIMIFSLRWISVDCPNCSWETRQTMSIATYSQSLAVTQYQACLTSGNSSCSHQVGRAASISP